MNEQIKGEIRAELRRQGLTLVQAAQQLGLRPKQLSRMLSASEERRGRIPALWEELLDAIDSELSVRKKPASPAVAKLKSAVVQRRLSEQIQRLTNIEDTERFVRQFRLAVREGRFQATYQRRQFFESPRETRRRSSTERYRVRFQEMLIVITPKFESWFDELDQAAVQARRRKRSPVTLEALESKQIDFQTAAARTRQTLQSEYYRWKTRKRARRVKPAKAVSEEGTGEDLGESPDESS